ncbi:unnamed protein product [Rhodiola kirilowii]
MEIPESGSGCSTGEVAPQSPLIPGLPDDVAICCLARVPRKYHVNLRCVSKRWRDLVRCDDWLHYRSKCGIQETWIYALCKDRYDQVCCYVLDPSANQRHWKPIRLFDDPLKRSGGIGFEVVGSKMYILGGCSWTEDSSDEVYCFDTLTNTLTTVASLTTARYFDHLFHGIVAIFLVAIVLIGRDKAQAQSYSDIPNFFPVFRCYFACETLNGKIYAIGGMSSPSSDAHSSETYDPITNSWTCISNPDMFCYIHDSTLMTGKIYIRGRTSIVSPIREAIYEPSSNSWQHLDSDMASGLRGPAVVADGILYVLDQTFGTKLIMWCEESREWVPVGRLSSLLTRPPCRLVAIGRTIYVIGTGLSTVIIDLDNIGNQAGVVVCSSIPNLDSHEVVLSCKCVDI